MRIENTIDVHDNFERAIKLLKISKRAVAERAGMAPGSLVGILKNNNPTVEQLVSLSKGLGISIRYLVAGGDPHDELRRNYVFEEFKEPHLREEWNPERPNVAARVEIILKKTRQTKVAAAKRVHAISSWWSPILKRNNPTVSLLQKIAAALQVEPIDLLVSVSCEEYGEAMIPCVGY